MFKQTLSAFAGGATVVAIVMGGASGAFAQASEENMARCQQLYSLWSKHNGTSPYGKVLDADMGIEHCRKGEYAAGVKQLKSALNRSQIRVTPAVETANNR